MSSSFLIESQYSEAIDMAYNFCLQCAPLHDVPRAMHFGVLLNGRRPVGCKVFTNAVNVRDTARGPNWLRAQDGSNERSIHAEARAAQYTTTTMNSRRARRHNIYSANGILVCRFTYKKDCDIRECLRFSLPCKHCVEVLSRCGFSSVVFSTGDLDRPWEKLTMKKLLSDPRVQPISRLRTRTTDSVAK